MPELPDLSLYLEAFEERLRGRPLKKVFLKSPFVLRTVEPPLTSFVGKRIIGLDRLGKRLVWKFEDAFFLVFHLMIAGRFHWKNEKPKTSAKNLLALFEFENGYLLLTEAASKKRAALYAIQGEQNLKPYRRTGIEVLNVPFEVFHQTITAKRHTLKRMLTDPNIISGIGNAYSDEILHHAKLSPLKRTDQLSQEESKALYKSIKITLEMWIQRLREKVGTDFPEKVTAFHEEMAVHGKYQKPCPVCQTPVQRIRYATNEANYCPKCQTDGKLLADRSLSRLLKQDWPKTWEELEQRRKQSE